MVRVLSYILFLCSIISCGTPSDQSKQHAEKPIVKVQEYPRFSLAQWTFHKELFSGEMNTIDFIDTAAHLGFEGVEYVNQFFKNQAADQVLIDKMNAAAARHDIRNLLIMVDAEGDLGNLNLSDRKQAITNHKKWIDMAYKLGCHSIRVNAHGTGARDSVWLQCKKSIIDLADYAAAKKINILIENHGGYSSDATWLRSLIDAIQKENVGSLPDLDNWCTRRDNGKLWGGNCIDRYDAYAGMLELLPYAQAVSIKSKAFLPDGEEKTIDYPRIIPKIKASGYHGFLGVEYEGTDFTPVKGALKTRALVEKYW